MTFKRNMIDHNGPEELYVVKDTGGRTVCYHIVLDTRCRVFHGLVEEARDILGKPLLRQTLRRLKAA